MNQQSASRKITIAELEKILQEDDLKVCILPNGEVTTRPKTEADYAEDREAARREREAAARKHYTVRFDLSETQQKALTRLAEMEPGWHYASIVVRSNGQDHSFDATWLRPILKAIRLNRYSGTGPEGPIEGPIG